MGVRNTVAIGTAPKPSVLQLIHGIGFACGRLTIRVDCRLTPRHRAFQFSPMDASNKGTLHGGLNPDGSRMLSHLDDFSADVRLSARFADLADEDMDSTEGDPVPVLN